MSLFDDLCIGLAANITAHPTRVTSRVTTMAELIARITAKVYDCEDLWVSRSPRFAAQRRVYDETKAGLATTFKADALAVTGLTNHPKADQAFKLAWERGHSEGLGTVAEELADLAELLV